MTTPITIQCKSCEKTLKVPASLIGKTGNCPSCKAEMKFVPAPLPSQKAATGLSPIIIQCKSCEETLKVPASLIGKTGKCPSCKAEMKFVPAPLPMNRIPVVLPTGMASAPLPKPALVKKGHDTALVLTAVLFGLPLVACGGCLGLALVFAPSKEVRERMRVEQAARNAEADAAKATEAAQAARNAETAQAARNAEAARPKMTYASFLSVSEGMTYPQVEAIVGKPDKLISSVEIGGIKMVMVGWDVGVTMTYENGKLISKAQFGLR